MKGIQILTDKNHHRTELEVFPTFNVNVARAMTLAISEEPITGFQGFGVAITGASCHELSLMDPEARKELLNKVYSKDGIGLSVGRLSIGSSDYSAELYSYDDVPFDTELRHFSIERDQKYIIPMIKEILSVNPDLFLFASPWSPPSWMKTGGNLCGGYMREVFLECYAEYTVKYIKAYAENGIIISAMTPQNEPNTQQSGTMPACIWHPELEAKYIGILKEKLQESNLDVKIWMFDHNFADANRVLWSLDNCEGLANNCDGVAFHYYAGTIEETKKIRKAYPELDMHFTEAGPRLYDHYGDDWCKWGIMVSKALKCGNKSFTGWNLMLNEIGGPNIGPFLCGGLVTRHTVTGELDYSGQYKAFNHIAPYIRKDSEVYSVSVNEEYDVQMHAYPQASQEIEGFLIDNHDGKYVLVLINPNDDKQQTQFFLNGSWWYVELTPESISTIILED